MPTLLSVVIAALVVSIIAAVAGLYLQIQIQRQRKVEELEFGEEFVPELGGLEPETGDITRDVELAGEDETRTMAPEVISGITADETTKNRVLRAVARLTVLQSNLLAPGRRFELLPIKSSIGRHPENDIVIPDLPVSRWHSEIGFDDEANEFRIYDIGSTYGTRVNGEPVSREGAILRDGDEIQLGTRTVLEFALIRREKQMPEEGAQQK